MRKKLMLLAALTCAAGGAALLIPTPADSQSYPFLPCSEWVGQYCMDNQIEKCMNEDGGVELLECRYGFFVVGSKNGGSLPGNP
jgi:hypothetical protein